MDFTTAALAKDLKC